MFWVSMILIFLFFHFIFSKLNYYKYSYIVSKTESTGLFGFIYNLCYSFINSNNKFLLIDLNVGYNVREVANIDSICHSILNNNFTIADKAGTIVYINHSQIRLLSTDGSFELDETILPPSTVKLVQESLDKVNKEHVTKNKSRNKSIF